MCQIQLIKKLNGNKVNQQDINEFFKLMCFGSMHNDDAFGVFNRDYSIKTFGTFNSSVINESKLKSNDFLVGHNRLACSGCFGEGPELLEPMEPIYLPPIVNFCIRPFRKRNKPKNVSNINSNINNHPFKVGDFLLVHNGIIDNTQRLKTQYRINTDILTDSYIILWLIDYFFGKSLAQTRIKRVVEAIQLTAHELNGSYSVVLYDAIDNLLYYFKNWPTEFNFVKYGNILVGSTRRENLDYVYFNEKIKEEIDVEPEVIYVISNDKKKPLKIVGRFKEKGFFASIFGGNGNKTEFDKYLKDMLGLLPKYEISKKGNLKILRFGKDDAINSIARKFKIKKDWIVIDSSDLYELKGGQDGSM